MRCDPCRRSPCSGGIQNVLLVFALAGLALFSLLSILLSVEDGRESTTPDATQYTWVRFGLR
jgi:hypothetical protein